MGVYVQTPAAVQATVPWAALGLSVVTVSESPSTSESLASTFTFPAVPWAVVSESLTAFGASFTGVTVMETVAVSVPPWPSEIV